MPFRMTSSATPVSAKTASQSGVYPAMAATSTANFTRIENKTFSWMLRTVRHPRSKKAGSAVGSSDIRATSAVSSAVSEPAAPIAMPMSALSSAGA